MADPAATANEGAPPTDPNKICGTSVTIQLVQDIIANDLKLPEARITKWTGEDIALGKGFLSVMAKLQLTWSIDSPKLPKTVMAKIPTSSKLHYMTSMSPEFEKMAQQLMSKLHLVHNAEVSIYDVFSKMGDDKPVKLPYAYGWKNLTPGGEQTEPAYIIMEDLSGVAGLRNMLAMETLSEGQTREIATQLARLHAWSLKHQEELGRIETMDLMQVFAEQYASTEQGMQAFLAMLQTPAWQKVIPADLAAKVPRLLLKKETILSLGTLHQEFGLPTVLTHGDIHTNNMLFEYGEDGAASGPLKAIIDFQIIHLGSALEDLSRLLGMCINRDLRTPEFTGKMIAHYLEEFESAYGAEPPFDKRKFQQCFEKTQVIFGCMWVPMIPQFIAGIESGKMPTMPGVDLTKMADNMRQDVKEMIEHTLPLVEKLDIH